MSVRMFNIPNTFIPPATITSILATQVPLTIKGASGQTADIQQWQDANATVLARLDSGGKLGLGTAPAYQLHVLAATSAGTPAVYIQNSGDFMGANVPSATATGHDVLVINEGGTKKWRIGYHDTSVPAASGTGSFRILSDAAGFNCIMVDNSTGAKVGIGNAVAQPAAQLDVRPTSASTIGQVIVGAASQTADLQQWQDSTSAVKAALTATGGFKFSPTTQTTSPAAGGAGALPATPAGYAQITINGTARLVPYY